MEILIVILIGGAAVFFLMRNMKKSIKDGDECAGCGSKSTCKKPKNLERRDK